MEKQPLLVLMIAGLIGLVGCNARLSSRAQPNEHLVVAGEIGSRLPDFVVPDLQGRPLLASDLRGKVVLVDFWATWCAPCKKEMPGYQKLADRYGSRGFAVIGFKFDTMRDMEDPLQFAEGIGVRYPLAVGTEDLKRKLAASKGYRPRYCMTATASFGGRSWDSSTETMWSRL